MSMKIVAQANIKASDLVNGYLNDTTNSKKHPPLEF